MDSKSIVCSLFLGDAKEFGPLFSVPSFQILKRAAAELMEQRKGVPPEVVFVYVHGEFDMSFPKKPFQPFLLPLVYKYSDWSAVSWDFLAAYLASNETEPGEVDRLRARLEAGGSPS